MQEQEMLNDLIMESREHLEKIEPDLLELESKGNNVSDELINRVFRAVHSIKGGFGFFGIENIVTLSHAMENVMSKVRDKRLDVSAEVADALLSGVDKLRVLLDDVGGSESIDISTEVSALKPFLDDVAEKKVADPKDEISLDNVINDLQQIHPDFAYDDLIDTIKKGMCLYQIHLHEQDIDKLEVSNLLETLKVWERFGEILHISPQRELLEDSIHGVLDISIIFATVLEPDLIGEALQVEEELFFAIDLTDVKAQYRAEQKKLQENGAHQSGGENVKSDQKKVQSTAVQKGNSNKNHDTGGRIEDALRVKVSLLNNLMNFAGELVLGRNQLIQTMGRKVNESPEAEKAVKIIIDYIKQMVHTIVDRVNDSRDVEGAINEELQDIHSKIYDMFSYKLRDIHGVNSIVQNIDIVTTVLQENIMQTRMQPINVVFSKFPRIIRDLAKKLNKEIELEQIGQDVELDKSIIEMLSDPLTHLIRNCADHAIEMPHDRKGMGKNPAGTVILKAAQEGGKVIIEIEDDGRGIDAERVKERAIEKGVISQEKADSLSEKELQMLIFEPGFSTAVQVSDVSGRGVGMDVVKTNVERLGGVIDLESVSGMGTRVIMKLPLTLAIIPSLIVTAGGRRFAVPQVGLEEVVRIRARDVTKQIERIHNSEVLRLRGKLLPLVRLDSVLGIGSNYQSKNGSLKQDRRERWSDRRGLPDEQNKEIPEEIVEKRQGDTDRRVSVSNALKIVVLKMENKLFGLVVDNVQDSEEIVVKPMPEFLKSCQCYSGITIMGDGKVAMILDPNGIATMAGLQFDALEKEMIADSEAKKTKEELGMQQNLLLFSIGGPEHFGIDLSMVSRIEKRDVSEIELIGNKEFLKYEDYSLELFRLENYLPVQSPHGQEESLFVLVPKNMKRPIGIVTSKVEDTVETSATLDTQSMVADGIKGSIIINGQMVIIVDVDGLLKLLEVEFA